MTTPGLTAVEAARVAAFDAAPAPPEVLRLKVARAIADSDRCDMADWDGIYEERADAVLAVMRDQPRPAVQRIWALVDELESGAAGSPGLAVIAHRIRAAIAGDEPCRIYSHGVDGWHCATTGPHQQHTNAAGDVTW